MEIKAILNKPYTDKQRLDFIVENQGCKIKETKTALEAWGLTEEEKAEKQNQERIQNIYKKLDELDLKAIRPMRAKEAGTATEEDLARLAEIEQQAQEYRSQLGEKYE